MSTRQPKSSGAQSMPHGGPQFRLLCGGLRSRVVDDLSDVMDRLLNKDIPPLRLHPQHAQSQSGKRSTRHNAPIRIRTGLDEIAEFSPNIRYITRKSRIMLSNELG